ncbi:MAG: (2Fe-2S)-binding protein [Tenericutes bacterium HGW-Tenericutes-6]|jgi:bacterioferritin-associated ferredoxin|nr:MAG: (2Fe-2S)-binding protein [Tenericutes bacterium HGW-Tenericutes-7]PKK93851.1 MAG: (2Fe-2S)-binding protein [Tenericutes bacterium HGW-Tenericutes-6]
MNKKDIIICRCEDVSLDQIHALLEQGYTTFEDLKRLLRVGMGPCQANTCGPLIQREIAQFLGKKVEEIPIHKVRPLVLGVPLEKIAKGDDHES